MSEPSKAELVAAEDAGWAEMNALVESLSPAQAQEPGYYELWSVKDMVGHIACWMSEAVDMLERIRVGTYDPSPRDVDELNASFYEAMKDLSLGDVRSECFAARNRMLSEWDLLPEVTPDAVEWFVESGAEHYAEHTPRLREWVGNLRGDG
jgi:hypothetical protein